MIYLYLFLFLLALLLFYPVTVNICYLEEFSLSVRWLFIKIKILPAKEKNENKEKKSKDEGKGKKEPSKKVKKEKSKEEKKRSISEIINIAADILRGLKTPFGKFFKHIKIRNLELEISTATEDSAKTAFNYTLTAAAVSMLESQISKIFSLKAKSINVYPDFTKETTRIYLKTDIKMSIAAFLSFCLSVLFSQRENLKKLLNS